MAFRRRDQRSDGVFVRPSFSASGWIDEGLLSTGFAYGAFSSADGQTIIVGIVPEGVTNVTFDGRDISILNNVWYVETRDALSRDLQVTNDSGVVAHLG